LLLILYYIFSKGFFYAIFLEALLNK